MSKVKRRKPAPAVFAEIREQLGPREVVAPEMGTNRISLYRWEKGIHPIPPWAFRMLELLREKYPYGMAIPEEGPGSGHAVPARSARPLAI